MSQATSPLMGQTALVTGASRGIGKAVALELAAAGATVAVNYANSNAGADAVVAEITAKGGSAYALQADVSQEEEVNALVEAVIKRSGSLDVLVNNAGITRDGLLMRMKTSAMIVNTSRAELIEPDALISSLNRGRPGLAAIDVFEHEPILQGHALLRLENCICTPHIGYVEKDNYELYFGAAFDNVVNFIKGTPTNIVNPGSLQVRR